MCLQANFEAGVLNPIQKNEQVNYWPSSVEHTDEVESKKATTSGEQLHGTRQRTDYGAGKENITGDDYKQPGDRIRGFSKASRENLLHHLVAWITDPKVCIPQNPSTPVFQVVKPCLTLLSLDELCLRGWDFKLVSWGFSALKCLLIWDYSVYQ